MGSQSWTRLKDFHFHFHCSITNHQSSATVTCVILQFTHINQPGQTHLYPSALGPGRQPSRCPPDSGSRVTRGHSQIHRGGWPQLPADNWQEAPQAPSDPSAPGGHRISRKQPRFLVAVWYQRASEAHASTEQSPSLCQTPQLRSQVGSHYAVRPGGLSTEVWRFPSAQPPRPFPGPEPWRAAGQRGPQGLLLQGLVCWWPFRHGHHSLGRPRLGLQVGSQTEQRHAWGQAPACWEACCAGTPGRRRRPGVARGQLPACLPWARAPGEGPPPDRNFRPRPPPLHLGPRFSCEGRKPVFTS